MAGDPDNLYLGLGRKLIWVQDSADPLEGESLPRLQEAITRLSRGGPLFVNMLSPDDAEELSRAVRDDLFDTGGVIWSALATNVLVEALLRRGGDADRPEAHAAVDRLAAVPTDPGFVLHEIWLLRLRALLASARGDETVYRELRDRYRDMAKTLGFEGHIEWADAMP